ncbi:MAG TPA: hypothetical protein ENN99_01580, partial [Chloroflexi bacterium]|nr:hypothetical protein [Chloroflexota bacterium]
MPIDQPRVRQHLAAFDFASLFVEELGWDHHRGVLPVQVSGEMYTLDAIAQKRGMAAYVCQCVSIPP